MSSFFFGQWEKTLGVLTKKIAINMIINTAARINTVEEYYFSRKLKELDLLRKNGQEIINLGIGSPDLPPAPAVVTALGTYSESSSNHGYQSYRGIPALRAAYAAWYKKYFSVDLNPESEVLPLIGSKEGIMHLSMTFLEAGDEVLIPNPGYPAYAATARLAGATVRYYELNEAQNWLPNLTELAQTDLTKVKIMWINYPHMPTGTAASADLFEKLVQFAQIHKILLVNDNPYSFILNEQQKSILSVPGAKTVALELNSLSKSHNMAGWRMGILAGDSAYLQEVMKFKSNMDSGMFRPAMLAAVEALKNPPSWYENLNAVYRERRAVVYKIMDALNCAYRKDQVGLFVWAKIKDPSINGFELVDKLLVEKGIFVTPGGIFGSQGDDYIRISLCAKETVLSKAYELITI